MLPWFFHPTWLGVMENHSNQYGYRRSRRKRKNSLSPTFTHTPVGRKIWELIIATQKIVHFLLKFVSLPPGLGGWGAIGLPDGGLLPGSTFKSPTWWQVLKAYGEGLHVVTSTCPVVNQFGWRLTESLLAFSLHFQWKAGHNIVGRSYATEFTFYNEIYPFNLWQELPSPHLCQYPWLRQSCKWITLS